MLYCKFCVQQVITSTLHKHFGNFILKWRLDICTSCKALIQVFLISLVNLNVKSKKNKILYVNI